MAEGLSESTTTLWDRSRQLAMESILDTALDLFERQGYEQTTIAQVASEAGISQRSLFRYFGSKEDLACGDQDALGGLLLRTVREQPPEASAWDALRAGFAAVLRGQTPERSLRLSRLIFGTPSLHAGFLTKRLRWQPDLVPDIERRLGIEPGRPADPRARAVIATAFVCADIAARAWVDSDGQADVEALYDEAIATVTHTPGTPK